jgi:hypothetical protein
MENLTKENLLNEFKKSLVDNWEKQIVEKYIANFSLKETEELVRSKIKIEVEVNEN